MAYEKYPNQTGQNWPVSTQYATFPGSAVGVPVSPQYDTFPSGSVATPATIFSGIIDYLDGDTGAGAGAPWVGSHAGHSWTAINTPTYNATLLNGHGGFSLVRASAQRFENTTLDLPAPPFTIVAVVRQDGWNNLASLIAASSVSGRILQSTASPQIAQNNGSTVNNNGNLATATWGVVVAEFNDSTSDRVRAGGVDVTGANAGSADPAATLQIGAAGGAGHCSMSIVQAVFITGIPSAGEYTNYAAYVLARYGLTL